MIRDDLGDRMKKYEYITRTHLVPRTPVILRLDGKAFHTFTRGFKKPFDDIFITAMQQTTLSLCKSVQGCVFGYTQSDEITLVLVDYQKLTSSSWFDYNIQKCCSIAASMATLYFNRAFRQAFLMHNFDNDADYFAAMVKADERGAMFDARMFNVPKEEVANCLLWRQNDAVRNSVQMLGQAYFSHKQLQGLSCNAIKTMLEKEAGVIWDLLPIKYKRGTCCVKCGDDRPVWVIDEEPPVFKGVFGRDYIERYILIGCESSNGWISVKERLPKDLEPVNVVWTNRNPEPYYEDIKDQPFTGAAILYKGKWFWYSCVCMDYLQEYGDSEMDRIDQDIEILFWQAIPQPQKGKEVKK